MAQDIYFFNLKKVLLECSSNDDLPANIKSKNPLLWESIENVAMELNYILHGIQHNKNHALNPAMIL